MARGPRQNVYIDIEVSGSLFDKDVNRAVSKAIYAGLLEVAEKGVDFIREELHPGHGYDQGRFYESLDAIPLKGFRATATIPDKNFPTIRTWLERGRRRGVQTRRKGLYVFSHASSKTNRFMAAHPDLIVSRIIKELE
jgi:hypothetical protein